MKNKRRSSPIHEKKKKKREKKDFLIFFSLLSLFQFKGLSILFFFFIRGAKMINVTRAERQLIRDLEIHSEFTTGV